MTRYFIRGSVLRRSDGIKVKVEIFNQGRWIPSMLDAKGLETIHRNGTVVEISKEEAKKQFPEAFK